MLKGPAAAGLCPEKGVWERADACWKVSGRKSKKGDGREGITARTETLVSLPVILVSSLFLHSFSYFSKARVQSTGFPCVVFMTVLIPDSCSYPPLHRAFLLLPGPSADPFLLVDSPRSAFPFPVLSSTSFSSLPHALLPSGLFLSIIWSSPSHTPKCAITEVMRRLYF